MARKKKYTISIQLIELEDENYHILVETEFINKQRGKWAIDTGASKSVFDVNRDDLYIIDDTGNTEVKSAGIGEHQIETKTGSLPMFMIDGLVLTNWHVALIDLSYVNQLYVQFTNEKIIGLLGSDFLVMHNAVIDYKNLTLTFNS